MKSFKNIVISIKSKYITSFIKSNKNYIHTDILQMILTEKDFKKTQNYIIKKFLPSMSYFG